MPGDPQQQLILEVGKELLEWNNRHNGISTVVNISRWSNRQPKFIQDLSLFYKKGSSDEPVMDYDLQQDVVPDDPQEPGLDKLVESSMVDHALHADAKPPPLPPELLLLFYLEQHDLRNSASRRNAGVQAFFSATYESNSAQTHKNVMQALDNSELIPAADKAAYQKIIRYLYLSGITDVNMFWKTIRNKPAEITLAQLANIISHRFHNGTLIDRHGALQVSEIAYISGFHTDANIAGFGYWQFSAANSSAASTAVPNSRYRIFADLGGFESNGLLSNELIKIFGGAVRRIVQDKAERYANNHQYSDNRERFENVDIKLNLCMIKAIRAIQNLDLLFKANLTLGEIEKNKEAVKKELQALLTHVTNLQHSAEDFEQEIYSHYNKTLRELIALINTNIDSCHAVSQESLLNLQRDIYTELLRQYQDIQGFVGAKQNFIFENRANRDFREAQFKVQEFTMRHMAEVNEPMLNRIPNPGEEIIAIGQMNQPKNDIASAAISEAAADSQGIEGLLNNADALKKIHIKCTNIEEDLKNRQKNRKLSVAKSNFLPQETGYLSYSSLDIVEGPQSQKQRKKELGQLILDLIIKIPRQKGVLTEEEVSLEQLKASQVRSRNTVEPILPTDLGSGASEFFKHFFTYFERLGCKYPFIMTTAFSVPYMQFGFSAALLFMHGSFSSAMLKAIVTSITQLEASGFGVAHVPVSGAQITKLVNFTVHQIIKATGTESATEAVIAGGFLPAKVIFAGADLIVNNIFASGNNNDWLAEMRELASQNIVDGTPEEKLEKLLKASLALSLQLTIAVATGMGVHWAVTSKYIELQLLMTGVSSICNVNPNIYFGYPVGGNLVQKICTAKAAGIILYKINQIFKNTELNADNPDDIKQAMQRRRIERINEFKISHPEIWNRLCPELLQGTTAISSENFTDEAHKNLVTSLRSEIKNQVAGSNATEEATKNLFLDLYFMFQVENNPGLLHAFQNSTVDVEDLEDAVELNAVNLKKDLDGNRHDNNNVIQSAAMQPILQGVQYNILQDPSFNKRQILINLTHEGKLRNTRRQAIKMHDADFMTLSYFIELISVNPQGKELKELIAQNSFQRAKRQFEHLLFENPELWQLFADRQSVGVLKAIGLKRIKFATLGRILRFLWRDVFMRYVIGSICAPVVGFYVFVTDDKSNVPYPFRQFLGTTVFPALYRMLYSLCLPLVFLYEVGKNIYNHQHNIDKWQFLNTKKVLNTFLNIAGNIILILKSLATAILLPFIYILARIPEILIAAVTTNPIVNILHAGTVAVMAPLAAVGLIVWGIPSLMVGGIAILLGFEDFGYQCLENAKKPFTIFKSVMRAISDWRASHNEESILGRRGKYFDNIRATAIYTYRSKFRYILEYWLDNILRVIRDGFMRLLQRKVQKIMHEVHTVETTKITGSTPVIAKGLNNGDAKVDKPSPPVATNKQASSNTQPPTAKPLHANDLEVTRQMHVG